MVFSQVNVQLCKFFCWYHFDNSLKDWDSSSASHHKQAFIYRETNWVNLGISTLKLPEGTICIARKSKEGLPWKTEFVWSWISFGWNLRNFLTKCFPNSSWQKIEKKGQWGQNGTMRTKLPNFRFEIYNNVLAIWDTD